MTDVLQTTEQQKVYLLERPAQREVAVCTENKDNPAKLEEVLTLTAEQATELGLKLMAAGTHMEESRKATDGRQR